MVGRGGVDLNRVGFGFVELCVLYNLLYVSYHARTNRGSSSEDVVETDGLFPPQSVTAFRLSSMVIGLCS